MRTTRYAVRRRPDVWGLAFISIVAGCGYTGLGPAPAENSRDELVLIPSRIEEQCATDGVAVPPEWALESDIGCDRHDETYCFRLSDELREVAAGRDPRAALEASAAAFERHLVEGDALSLGRAQAFADLSVTGAASYEAFIADAPTSSDINTPSFEAAGLAIARAYQTLWALRGPALHRHQARAGLGWIATSPEDDLPGRPVNVPSTAFAQSDLPVTLSLEDGSTRTLRARLTVATNEPLAERAVPAQLVGILPNLDAPILPRSGAVLLYIHGHSSRAEESDTLTDELLDDYRDRGEQLTVISVDLPGSGYTERVDPTALLAAADPAQGPDVLLRFIEHFVVTLVDTLEERQPGISARIEAVMGGSLGGNMTLRLAERADELPWVRRAIAWSPVSIDYSWSRAKVLGGGDEGFTDIVKHEAVRRTLHESEELEDRGARARYFIDGVMSVRKQSSYWYREGWPCGQTLASVGLLQLAEIYDSRFRRFHYRLAYEQLVFSHIETSAVTGDLRYRSISAPLLLIAGSEDNEVPMRTHDFVRRLAPHLETPGQTLFFSDTGHALHAERPHMLAESVAAFVDNYGG